MIYSPPTKDSAYLNKAWLENVYPINQALLNSFPVLYDNNAGKQSMGLTIETTTSSKGNIKIIK